YSRGGFVICSYKARYVSTRTYSLELMIIYASSSEWPRGRICKALCVFCECVLANNCLAWFWRTLDPCPRLTAMCNCEEEFMLVIVMNSSRDAWFVRWDLKRQTFRLILPCVLASEGVS
ncbi:hypothetical protein A2U01_0030013, partial [Trifolium medium]|nr:hypothetical protein [Trifolium medium]